MIAPGGLLLLVVPTYMQFRFQFFLLAGLQKSDHSEQPAHPAAHHPLDASYYSTQLWMNPQLN